MGPPLVGGRKRKQPQAGNPAKRPLLLESRGNITSRSPALQRRGDNIYKGAYEDAIAGAFRLLTTRHATHNSKGYNHLSANVKLLEELEGGLGRHDRLIGVDLGTKTIGLALSDVSRSIASPLETIKRTKFTDDAERLIALAKQHEATALVFGLPLNMDGTEGPRCQSTRAFVRNLEKLTDLPVIFWDERMSTQAVTRTLLDADASRARRAELVDKMAAAYILQGALDRLRKL